jgi:ligand-binding sensor domain-containing protein
MSVLRLLACYLLLFSCTLVNAQQTPIGYWTSHFPYNDVISIATDGEKIFAASSLSFFTHDPASGETEAYSKAEGMADVGMAWVAFDKQTEYAILVYQNGNIDLFKDNSFYNIPDFKNRVLNVPKTIFSVYTENGLAYLSTSIGIVVVNLVKREIKETWEFVQNQITVSAHGLASTATDFYAVTSKGLYRISRSRPNPQIFSQWQQVNTKVLSDIAVAGNKLFVSTQDSLYVLENDTLRGFFQLVSGGDHLDEANGKLLLSKWNALQVFDPATFAIEFYSFFTDVKQAVSLADGSYWVADGGSGVAKAVNETSVNNYIKPNGPAGPYSFDIYAYDRNILVAHGSVTDKWVWQFTPDGFSEFKDGQWYQYSHNTFAPMKDLNLRDYIAITKDRSDGTIYAGSYRDGLFVLKADGSYELLRQSSPVEESKNNPGTWPIAGLALDENGTLWMSTFGTKYELAAKTRDNAWYKFDTPISMAFPNGSANVIIDDLGQKWYISPLGSGVIVYNDNNTPDNIADDTYRQLLAGAGAGNLPNNDVYALAKDKNNAIWIGTRAGIGIVNCADQATTTQCDAERPIVQFDQFAGYLFETEIVYTIAVDGANRKWIGTASGVWLLSPNGDEIIYRFTAEDSPLPSNNIRKITVDPVTGDVYIGTDKGLVCYRSTATDGGAENAEKLLAFPNPVPSGYSGSIAINGFVENADVRITDMSGQLVYRTTAYGGQAVWNGLDYNGRRPQSGVYLVFASNRDGTQTKAGKIVFMQ